MVGGTAGWVIGIAGLVPIAAGAADVWLVAPLFGAPFKGAEVRRRWPGGLWRGAPAIRAWRSAAFAMFRGAGGTTGR